MADAEPLKQLPEEPPRSAGSRVEPTFEGVLRSARLRLGFAAVLEAVLAAVEAGAAGLVVALLVVGSAPYSLALRFALLALVPLAAGMGAAFVVVRRAWPLRHDLVVGAALEASLRRRGAELGDAVRGAVELRDASQDGARGRSRALCQAHVAATTKQIVDGGGLSSLPGVALERALPTLCAAGAVFFVLLAWALGATGSWHERWDKLFTDDGEKRALEERAASLLPLVTDLKLTLRFPAYMQESDEVIPGSSGDVTAPRGTEVVVEGRADRALAKASLLVGENEIAAEAKGSDVTARFVVNESSTYRFRVTGVRGFSDLDPVAHKITVKADAAPVVSFEEPDADKVVKIDETVHLAFSAKDDVGITKFRVVVKRQGSARDPYVQDLMDLPNGGLREARGTGKVKIGDTGARPGDKLSVYIEALDNDAVNGPKAGRSQTRVLTVYSALEQHRTLIARLDDVMSRMVDSLGDELEAPLAALGGAPDEQRAAVERHRQIALRHAALAKAVDDALLVLAQDEMSPAGTRRALANMKLKLTTALDQKRAALTAVATVTDKGGAVGPSVRQHFAWTQKQLVERLEQDVLYLEDLLNKERLAEARQIADDLRRAQEDLKALIDQYKKTGDADTRKALLDQIKNMREEMNKLMQRLSELQRDIPDEYLNEEAFKGDKMLQEGKDIDKLIEEGKLDEAAKELDKMLESTKKMVDDLDKNGDQYGGDEYKELREKMAKFGSEFDSLQKAQQENLDDSQGMMERAKKQAEERLQGKVDKALAEVKKKVERAQKKLESVDKEQLFLNESEDAQFAKARIEDLKRALESKDLEDAASTAEEAEAAARSAERSIADRARGRFGQKDKATNDAKTAMGEARQELEDAKKALQEMVPDPSSLLDKGEKQKLGKDADREQQIKEGADKLGQMMDEMSKDAPMFGPNHKKRLDEAKGAMERAMHQMRGQDLRGARSSQRQALRMLADLKKDLTPQGGGKGGGSGMPMPFPGGGSPGNGEDEDGENGDGRQASHEEVKIPDGSEFKVPDAYRKDILDAMREGAPSSWAQEVKRYYESLIK